MKALLPKPMRRAPKAVSAKIVARWVERYKAEGRAGMVDRFSRPVHMPQATAAAKDFERTIASAEAWVVIVNGRLLTRILARP
ncbi:hypothetical protein X766_33470 [Mesorhizobium sp. LSJC255A00]|nr:hypothetical protein X766_33470 [Mesorhizobium sp. LSJC255A00]